MPSVTLHDATLAIDQVLPSPEADSEVAVEVIAPRSRTGAAPKQQLIMQQNRANTRSSSNSKLVAQSSRNVDASDNDGDSDDDRENTNDSSTNGTSRGDRNGRSRTLVTKRVAQQQLPSVTCRLQARALKSSASAPAAAAVSSVTTAKTKTSVSTVTQCAPASETQWTSATVVTVTSGAKTETQKVVVATGPPAPASVARYEQARTLVTATTNAIGQHNNNNNNNGFTAEGFTAFHLSGRPLTTLPLRLLCAPFMMATGSGDQNSPRPKL